MVTKTAAGMRKLRTAALAILLAVAVCAFSTVMLAHSHPDLKTIPIVFRGVSFDSPSTSTKLHLRRWKPSLPLARW